MTYDMEWKKEYQEKLCSPEDAVRKVKDGDRIYIGTAASVAYTLAEALYQRRDDFENVTICSGFSSRILPFYLPEAKGHFTSNTYFAGNAERTGIKNGLTVFTSFHLSQIRLWCRDIARINVAFLEVSSPDEEGYMSYGAYGVTFHNYVKEIADLVVLQVNPYAPYVCGTDHLIHVSEADCITVGEYQPTIVPNLPFDETIGKLSKYIVEEIPDGATIQLGIGGVSNAVGFYLREHNDLGIHTEMLTDSMMDLIKRGVVTNRVKSFMPGKSVVSFAFGTRELYDFVDHNEEIYFAPVSYVNDPYVIAKNDNMISINAAMAIDLYGQVAADCLDGKQQSAVGGQVDFVRGTQMARGGKSFIALPSSLERGDQTYSRIVVSLPPGSAVTTSRADVQYVATEYGCVNLKTLTMRDRARALISLAHPMFREGLTVQAKKMKLI